MAGYGDELLNANKEIVHANHRARLRARFRGEGLDAFEDHQVLELLLFFAIPRRDTNELAHLLLRRYGSLSGVLESHALDLERTDGVGAIAATLLTLMPALARRYGADRTRHGRPALTTSEHAAEFLLPLMAGRTDEVFYLVCLDTQCRVLIPAMLAQGGQDKVHVEPRQAVETALRHKAHSVILAHNHPTGQAKPTTADHRVTQTLVSAFGAIGITVRDHLVIAGDNWYSFARSGDMPGPKPVSDAGKNP